MIDKPSKRGPQDRSRINTSEAYEVRYWSRRFGVSPETLKAAVKKVGNSAKAVEMELKATVAS
jgi:predicted double-glycine peptidase